MKASMPYSNGHGLRHGIDVVYHRFVHDAMEVLMVTPSYQKLVFGSFGLFDNEVTASKGPSIFPDKSGS